MKTKFRPLRDLILIDPIKPKVATDVGIIVASEEQLKPSKGKVLAVGPGTYDKKGKLIEVPVKVGDVIMFSKGAMQKHTIDGEDFHLVEAGQLIGVES